jgi:hypothetical protein
MRVTSMPFRNFGEHFEVTPGQDRLEAARG